MRVRPIVATHCRTVASGIVDVFRECVANRCSHVVPSLDDVTDPLNAIVGEAKLAQCRARGSGRDIEHERDESVGGVMALLRIRGARQKVERRERDLAHGRERAAPTR